MSLFSKLSKNSDKTLYPWSQKKLGSSNALPRTGHAATAVTADAFIIYGGIHRGSTKKELFSIDANSLSANSINTSGDVPSSRISPVMVAMNGHVLLYGGKPISSDENYDAGFYLLNLHSKQWTRIQMEGNRPIERSGHSAVAHEGIMYIWGGQKEGNYFNDLFVFNSSTFNTTPRWEQLSYNNECPEPRSGHISAIFENKLFIFGGTDGHHLFNDVWSFDLHNGLWIKIEAGGYTPAPRESCASAVVDDVIYIIGGKGENGVELNDLCAYKIKSRRWFRFQNMGPSPSPRHGLTMTAIRDKLYVLGGDNDTTKLDDSSFIFILDSTKIKYPIDTPAAAAVDTSSLNSIEKQQQQQYDNCSIEEINPNLQQQHYYQHQQVGGHISPQQYQHSQQQQRQQSPHKEIDTSMNYADNNNNNNNNNNQPSPTSSSSPSSLSSPRHRSFHPAENQQQTLTTQPPIRPPRHMATVPEAALRRPRATSPLPQQESDIAADIRRQYGTNGSPTSPNSIENDQLILPRGSPMQASILSVTEDSYLDSHQRIMSPQQSSSTRSSPNNNGPLSPPPRPPREGVGLGNAQRSTIAPPDRVITDHEDRSKSQMPSRNQSSQQHAPQPIVPNIELMAAVSQLQGSPHQQQQQLLQQQMQQQAQQLAQQQLQQQQLREQQAQQQQLQQQQAQQQQYQQFEQILERSASRQLAQRSSPSPVNSGRPKQDNAAANEERQTLLREIKARDMIISEMKKKENWWRTEVSLARKQCANKGESFDEGPDADEALLMDIDHIEEDKVKLFEQLVSVKSELRRVRASILQQAQPMSEKVAQADRMRTAALQEAAYFKSKYLALKSRRQEDMELIEVSRCDELEKRLTAALTENEANSKILQQLQKRSQHDQTARVATEERAREAQERAEEAQQAHQRALEELQIVYTRATKAEVQVRDNAVKIADLTQQLSDALMAQPVIKSQEVTEAQLKASQLEAANLKARNEIAALKQKLAENMDDIARLRTILNEREDALTEAKIHVEDCEIQLGMMREAMNQQQQQHQKNSVNGFAPTRAY